MLELNKAYCIDALKGLDQIDKDTIDIIIFSPPYNCRKNYEISSDEIPWGQYYKFMGSVLDECYRVLTHGGTLAINVPNVVRWQFDHKYKDTWWDFDPKYKTHRRGEKYTGKGRIEPIGYNLFFMMAERDPHVREPITWVKGSEDNAICSDYRMGCDSDPYLRPCKELILLGSKDRWYHGGGTGRRGKEAVPFIDYTKDVWHIPPVRDKEHPATFPEEIPLRLIKLFVHAKDAIVLDPFVGRGTTMFATKSLGYSFIGFDTNQRWVRGINRKLSQTTLVD